MDNAAVSKHYNERRDEGKHGRKTSPIIRMRSFNNWVKSVLINLHTHPGYSVLDLCCGKGGDLAKWNKSKCSGYVACDTADVSIQQAAERFNSIDSTTFRPLFLVGDCFSVRLAEFYPAETEFDIVSCQFAMHYAFETETRVRQMLLNVTERLRPGGFFIGTTPDANVLVRKLRAIDGLTIGNGVFKIDFDSRFSSKVFPITGGSYGIRYNFSLDSNVEDCPEYLVHFPSFQELAKEYQLELILYCNFHEFYNEFTSGEYKDFRDLFQRMGVLDEQGTISPDEWDAIYLYVAFAFKKVGPVNQGLGVDSVKAKKWPSIADDDVVYMTQPSDTDVFSSNMGTLAKAASVNGRSGHLASENGTPSYH